MENKTVRDIISEIARTAQYLWERGWAERNAGNFSVNITDLVNQDETNMFSNSPEIPFSQSVYGPAGNIFLMTGTGTRMRDLAIKPEENICFIRVNKPGTGYQQYCLCREAGKLRPTSELPAHMAVQEMLLKKRPASKVLIHTHATELIALTHIPEMKSKEAINTVLWGMHPETLIFLPEGCGFLPYMLPGTIDIAKATTKELENHPVLIWEKHGVLATGNSVADAFDLIDLIIKPVRIFFQCTSAGFKPEGLSNLQLTEIRKNYLA